ncbi:MAG: DUF819 family protein [Bacteroidota bacterium]
MNFLISFPLENDAIVFGLLAVILWVIFKTSSNPRFKEFYTYVPAVLLCYFIPSIFNTLGIVSPEKSNLYYVASRFLLPASLVLLTISTDFAAILRLGPKALIMFFTASLGIILGGPFALWLMSLMYPSAVQGEGLGEIWRGMTTVAGSWMGGGANQTAMKEIYEVGDKLFSVMVTVDILVANFWMAFLLYGAGISDKIDRWLKADNSSIYEVQNKMADYQASIAKIPQLSDLATLLGIGFGVTAIGHLGADLILPWIGQYAEFLKESGLTSLNSGFFWLVVIVTTIGLILSFTPLRQVEGVGASKMGGIFIYILVAVIGMEMDVRAIFSNPEVFLLGIIWMLVHITLLILVARLIRAPFFFVAVGSQANVGGAASAPVVASAFHPSLATVGVLLAVLGYAIGTYGGIICGYLLEWVAA